MTIPIKSSHHFTQFNVWQKAMEFAKNTHELTKEFPKTEMYGMTDQMRRASLSIAANIAEGFGRYTAADKRHRYVLARGELIEVMTFIHHAQRIHYIDGDKGNTLLELAEDIYRMLNALITKMSEREKMPQSGVRIPDPLLYRGLRDNP